MGKLMEKIERKYGKYAIKNLPLYIVICYGFGYFMSLLPIGGQWMNFISLNPYAILHGQVWRLITWVLVPEASNLLFILIVMYFYYSLGHTLEGVWGKFYFNLYIFSGIIFTVIGAFVLFVIFQIFYKDTVSGYNAMMVMAQGADCPFAMGGSYFYAAISPVFSIYYINLSIFLAFALMYPDMKIYLFFVIPIKIKWMGIFEVIILIVDIINAFVQMGTMSGILYSVVIGSSLLNTFIFYLLYRNNLFRRAGSAMRMAKYKRQSRSKTVNIKKHQGDVKSAHKSGGADVVPMYIHKCTICGRTEVSDPDMTFRFCSKCSGTHEYCEKHIYDHEHIKE